MLSVVNKSIDVVLTRAECYLGGFTDVLTFPTSSDMMKLY